MRLKSYSFRGIRMFVGLVGLFSLSAASQAAVLLTHHLDNIVSGGATTNLMLYQTGGGANTSITYFFSSGTGDNAIFNPFPENGPPAKTSVIGHAGATLALGLNAAATADATEIGFDFQTYFGYDEADLYDAIQDVVDNVNVGDAFTLLFDFFADNEQHLVALGDVGSLVSFTNGNDRGDYYVTFDQDPTDVPEPFTMALGAAGAGLAAVRQRRRKMAK
jgi:MYXO-CTERM domain-containing protein